MVLITDKHIKRDGLKLLLLDISHDDDIICFLFYTYNKIYNKIFINKNNYLLKYIYYFVYFFQVVQQHRKTYLSYRKSVLTKDDRNNNYIFDLFFYTTQNVTI